MTGFLIVSRVVVVCRFDCTVKPVYNGHPWDLRNVAVMERVIRKKVSGK
jgi:hypothetical protein